MAHQPPPTALLLLAAVLLVRSLRQRSRGEVGAPEVASRRSSQRFLAGALAAYVAALLMLEASAPIGLALPCVALVGGRAGGRWRQAALVFAALAAAFGLVWVSVPKRSDLTAAAFEPAVGAYLLQGIAFPVTRHMARMGPDPETATWDADVELLPLIEVGLAVWALLVLLAVADRRGRAAAAASAWVVLALAPVWARLGDNYALLGPRLLYPALPGIAWLWAEGLAGAAGIAGRYTPIEARDPLRLRPEPIEASRGGSRYVAAGPRWGARRLGLCLAVALIVTDSLPFVAAQHVLWSAATRHLDRAIELVQQAGPDGRVLFVNFPDRVASVPSPFALGYWGLPLAPIGVDLAGFAASRYGPAPAVDSVALPALDTAHRAGPPYALDMRGIPGGPVEVVAAGRRAQAVFVTRYDRGGRMRLDWVGGTRLSEGPGPGLGPVADFGGVVRLWQAELDGAALRLEWQLLGSADEADTVFVHAYGADGSLAAQADGDPWEGMTPLWAWPAGSRFVDVRPLDPTLTAEDRHITVGIYNRASGERPLVTLLGGRSDSRGEVMVKSVDSPRSGF